MVINELKTIKILRILSVILAFGTSISKNYGNCVLYHVDLFKPRIYSGKRTFVTALTAQVQPFLCLRRLIHAPLKYPVTFVFSQMRKYAQISSDLVLLYSFMYILHTTTLKCHIWMCECHFCLLLKRCENLRFYQFLVTFWPLMTPDFIIVLNIGHRCVE